jgi:phospholipid N-methyltransferase
MLSKEKAKFLREFFQKPGAVGAVLPSSRTLAVRMVDWIDWPNVRTVIEYGPGTGAFTGHILSHKHAESRFFAIEINPSFVAALGERYPRVRVYQDSVKNVKAICHQEGIEEVDAIVCGLPWAAFGEEDQAEMLNAMMAVLKPGGQFATFAYLQGLLLPAGRRFRSKLCDCFSQIDSSRTAWLNFPPALVYRCRR